MQFEVIHYLCDMKDSIVNLLSDLVYLTLSPRRYDTPTGTGDEHWRGVIRRYGNAEKRIQCGCSPWYVIEYKDGHKELAYLRVLQNGLLSGLAPAIYRGFIPRRVTLLQFDNVERIRLAF